MQDSSEDLFFPDDLELLLISSICSLSPHILTLDGFEDEILSTNVTLFYIWIEDEVWFSFNLDLDWVSGTFYAIEENF